MYNPEKLTARLNDLMDPEAWAPVIRAIASGELEWAEEDEGVYVLYVIGTANQGKAILALYPDEDDFETTDLFNDFLD